MKRTGRKGKDRREGIPAASKNVLFTSNPRGKQIESDVIPRMDGPFYTCRILRACVSVSECVCVCAKASHSLHSREDLLFIRLSYSSLVSTNRSHALGPTNPCCDPRCTVCMVAAAAPRHTHTISAILVVCRWESPGDATSKANPTHHIARTDSAS